MEIRDFPTLVNKCRFVVECNRKLNIAKFDACKKRPTPTSQDFEDASPLKKQFHSGKYEDKQSLGPVIKQICPNCGRNHGGKPCFVGQNVCFNYGKPGHFVKECPCRYQPPTPKPQHPGRVFTLNVEETTSPEELKRN